ncbi:hypothetical protein ACLOJK_001538 [Asimina triloba]
MGSHLLHAPSPFRLFFSSSSRTTSKSRSNPSHLKICCGPRDNRSPLQRGRVLSTEAMLAVQTLKRASARGRDEDAVFNAVRRESWYQTDYALHAEIVSALAKNGMMSEIDQLVAELLEEGFFSGGNHGLTKLLKVLIQADRAKLVVDLYGMMKSGNFPPDEYISKVVSKGLRRLGETSAADEVDKDLVRFLDGNFKPELVV